MYEEIKDILNIPNDIYDKETQRKLIEYINSLNETELKALIIAKNHLKSSFNLYKSNGFQEFLSKKK